MRPDMTAKQNKGVPTGRCTICMHPERARIDFLATTAGGEWGSGRRALATKFGVSSHALYRHCKAHISAEYRRAVKIGPFSSEEHLRQLLADTGASVLDRFNGLYNGHLARWLGALEANNDALMLEHGRVLSMLLGKVGILTREMLPPGAHTKIENNFFLSPDFMQFQQRALRVLRRHPEAMQDWIAEFRPDPPRMIEHAEAAAD
jgi:hypothetical protein